ncbi:NAD(P)/FAD-dependent oxidoreductase [Natrarchaeobius chitinivorans]|uniref:FAD-dependent oxidoreductase n=1 Tax=Natrarchaeobius chitinivorans TaxID=1679083 RepID=A0A3N6M0S5_NATCH|nr:FAD-dependent oxidoreductase [Natrarchaeobius chitinivorans]RQG95207.1 FAD-dependent oxidoreductase [Natrarchaeobius chitinivorans]
MAERFDAVVVGGGIVGSSVGYHLARAGVETAVIDRADAGRATDAGAGIVSPPTSSLTGGDEQFEFATNAAAYYPELVDRLRGDGVEETSYERVGIVGVAVDDDEIEPYDERLERVSARNFDRLDEIEPDEARERFPALAEPKRAFHYADAARIDGRVFTDSLLTAARTHGLTTYDGDVDRIRIDRGRVTGVETAGGKRIDAETVVLAGGVWSSAFEGQLGVELPLEPRRGQIARLNVPDTDTSSWPIVTGFRHHYLVPLPDGTLVCGATLEADAGFDPRPTASGVEEVLAEAQRLVPDLADATVADLRVGLRPISGDGLPIIGAVPETDGAYVATGHGSSGLMLGPHSGRVVAELVSGERTTVPDPLSVDRLADV